MAGTDPLARRTALPVLALDTATEALSLALILPEGELAACETVGRRHSELLAARVRALLARGGVAPSDLAAIAVGVGPGSFVGVRVGVAFAKGMASALDIPVHPLGSLELLAAAAPADRVACAIDARMGQVYFARFVRDGEWVRPVEPPAVLDPDALPRDGDCLCVGTGFVTWPGLVERLGRRGDPALDLPDVRAASSALRAGRLPPLEPAALEPVYLRNRVALTRAQRGLPPQRPAAEEETP